MYDTLIIGAGMSGLAAGIRLAYYDRKVCIVERHTTIGGLNSFYRLRNRDYDVGLHALTNYVPKGTRRGPLATILKQLRFRWEDFALVPQRESAIRFPGIELRFGNGLQLLTAEIDQKFPHQRDCFQNLLRKIVDYDDLDQQLFDTSARSVLEETITDPLLMEMLLCPLMWYGNPRERDMGFGPFCILFRSIYMEGFARPVAGVRLILKNLVRRYRELGGELKLRHGVARIKTSKQRVSGVVLDDGNELDAANILSSAGFVETLRLCNDDVNVEQEQAGKLSFTEAVSILDCKPQQLGLSQTIVFFNDSDKFHWEVPNELCDLRTGVICSPNNYLYSPEDAEARLPIGAVRITSLASYPGWVRLPDPTYQLEKLHWYDAAAASAVRFVPDFRRHVIDTDFFTPRTIHRFTGHTNGAVYGSVQKHLDGRTPWENLYICGTDQGYVGIIGAIISGVSIANQYLLR